MEVRGKVGQPWEMCIANEIIGFFLIPTGVRAKVISNLLANDSKKLSGKTCALQ